PVRIAELLSGLPEKDLADVQKSAGFSFRDKVSAERLVELHTRYRSPWGNEPFGHDYQEAWRRVSSLKAYLGSYEPSHLKDARPADPDDAKVAQAAFPTDQAKLRRGAQVFGQKCARCHSSKQPYGDRDKDEPDKFFEWSAQRPLFLKDNFLSDEKRY